MSRPAVSRALVLGLGNPILTDDGIGVRLAEHLRRSLPPDTPADVQTMHAGFGLDLLDTFADREHVIVIDALKARDMEPGYWFHFTLAGLRHTRYVCHLHDLNLATVIELGRRIGVRLPLDTAVHIFGVAVFDDSTFGESLSAPLAAAYPRLEREIEHELLGMLKEIALPA